MTLPFTPGGLEIDVLVLLVVVLSLETIMLPTWLLHKLVSCLKQILTKVAKIWVGGSQDFGTKKLVHIFDRKTEINAAVFKYVNFCLLTTSTVIISLNLITEL